jgi:DNA-binding NarL/FixJ family response regulator
MSELHRTRDRIVLAYPRPPELLGGLTRAETDIAQKLADGLSNEDIARLREASPRTVANQIAALYRKSNVRCRRELTLRLFGGRLCPIDTHTLEVLELLR